LVEIAEARVEVLVLPLEVRTIPLAREMHLSGPWALRVGERDKELDQLAPVLGRP